MIELWEDVKGWEDKYKVSNLGNVWDKEKNVVNHIDENKTNNYYKNLEWTTIGGNTKHSLAKKINQIDKDTNDVIKTHDSIADAIKHLGKPRNYMVHISEACNNPKRVTALGYKWKFAEK